MCQPYLAGKTEDHGNPWGCIPGHSDWEPAQSTLRLLPCPLSQNFHFVESGAEEEAAAGTGPTLIQSQELGRASGSVLKPLAQRHLQHI